MIKEWSTEILRGYVFESQSHSPALMEVAKTNILIDGTGHARLADFGLLTIISDTTSLGSSIHGGTFRWMSPELFYPENFGLKDSRRTKHSDCYALGMVIWEVLSGQVPFPRCDVYAVVAKVSRGERPTRPQGAGGTWFTDRIWSMLERCWTPRPGGRPRTRDVLWCLEEVSRFWMASPLAADSPTQSSSDSDTEGSMENEVTFTSCVDPQKGNADEKPVYPPFSDAFTAPLQPDVDHPSGSDLEGSATVTERGFASRMFAFFILQVLSLLSAWRAKIRARREKVSPMYSAETSPSKSRPDSLLPSATIPHEGQDYYELAQQLLPLLPAACIRLESNAVLIIDAGPFSSGPFSEVWRASSQGLPVVVKSLWCYSSPEFDPAEIGIVSCLPMSAIETALNSVPPEIPQGGLGLQPTFAPQYCSFHRRLFVPQSSVCPCLRNDGRA